MVLVLSIIINSELNVLFLRRLRLESDLEHLMRVQRRIKTYKLCDTVITQYHIDVNKVNERQKAEYHSK